MTTAIHINPFYTAVAVALLAAMLVMQANAIEEPSYTVERAWETEQIEIRRYAPRVMAITTMEGNDNDGFRVLAGYIFVAMQRSRR